MRTTIDFPIINFALRCGGKRPACLAAGAVAPHPVVMAETAAKIDSDATDDEVIAQAEDDPGAWQLAPEGAQRRRELPADPVHMPVHDEQIGSEPKDGGSQDRGAESEELGEPHVEVARMILGVLFADGRHRDPIESGRQLVHRHWQTREEKAGDHATGLLGDRLGERVGECEIASSMAEPH